MFPASDLKKLAVFTPCLLEYHFLGCFAFGTQSTSCKEDQAVPQRGICEEELIANSTLPAMWVRYVGHETSSGS